MTWLCSSLDASRELGPDPEDTDVGFTKTWVHSAHPCWRLVFPSPSLGHRAPLWAAEVAVLNSSSHGETTRHMGRELRAPGPQSLSDKCASGLWTLHSRPQQQDNEEGAVVGAGWGVSDRTDPSLTRAPYWLCDLGGLALPL